MTFVGYDGKRCTPSLGWRSSRRPGGRLPAAGPARPGLADQLQERARQEASGRAGSPNFHPIPSSCGLAPTTRSARDAPFRPQGRGRGNPEPVRPSPRRVTVGSEGDPHCDRSTPGRRPLPHPPGPRNPTSGRQAGLGEAEKPPWGADQLRVARPSGKGGWGRPGPRRIPARSPARSASQAAARASR